MCSPARTSCRDDRSAAGANRYTPFARGSQRRQIDLECMPRADQIAERLGAAGGNLQEDSRLMAKQVVTIGNEGLAPLPLSLAMAKQAPTVLMKLDPRTRAAAVELHPRL